MVCLQCKSGMAVFAFCAWYARQQSCVCVNVLQKVMHLSMSATLPAELAFAPHVGTASAQ